MLLIFEDDNGIETIIRGGPEFDPPRFIEPIPTGGVPGVQLVEFGRLVIENGLPIEASSDARTRNGIVVTPQTRGIRGVPVIGRSPQAVWSILQQYAAENHRENFLYLPLPNVPPASSNNRIINSNTVIAELLYLVGGDIDAVLPNPIFGETFSCWSLDKKCSRGIGNCSQSN
ncbi:MAG: hypothetical protein ACFB2W_17675 [Leptolyngbyaceae cyanobacterium]